MSDINKCQRFSILFRSIRAPHYPSETVLRETENARAFWIPKLYFFFFLLSYQFYYHNLMLLVLKCTQHSSLATIFSTRSSILPTTSYEQTQHIQFQNSFFTDVLANFPNDRFFDTRLREELTSKAV